MSTEVKHGPHPRFKAPLAKGRYGLTIRGRYTKIDGLTAAGVTEVRWNSTRAVKRRAELLGMRTAFVCWFMAEWRHCGGSWAAGKRALTKYPFWRLRTQLLLRRSLSLAALRRRVARDREGRRKRRT